MIDSKQGILSRLVLNDAQHDAVVYDGGPQLVFAGAGTGKTRVLTAKIAWLIDRGVVPSRIFAATFTNKAAKEMRTRVEKFIYRPIGDMWIGTFHSLCARLLRIECQSIGYRSTFSIYDDTDQLAVVRKVIKRLEIDDRTALPKQLLSSISRFKNQCISVDDAMKNAVGFVAQEEARIYATYQKILLEQQAMDFDDLLLNAVKLLRDHEAVLDKYRQRFDHLLVDEYQDTNLAQMNLIRLLCGAKRRIFAVGDDDQSIYGWRGAQIENILRFEEHFPDTKIFKLEQNYRSSGAILDFANSAIEGNNNRTQKKLWTDKGKGSRVTVSHYRDDRQEAQAVAQAIKKACLESSRGGEIAVLFRTNAQSRVFEETLRKMQIGYVLVGGMSFYERAEIKDCLAYLRLLVNRDDNVSFERIFNVPARGLGDKALEALSEMAAENRSSFLAALLSSDPERFASRFKKGFSDLRELFGLLNDAMAQGEAPHELLKELLQLSGYVDMLTTQQTEEAVGRLENVNELLNALALWSRDNPGRGLESYIEEVSLAGDVDLWQNRGDAVNLMTMHCAKGLEFDTVFLVGLEEGILPSRQNFDDDAKIEEERRLLYVGATRARQRLACSYVDRRYRFGEVTPQAPSRFLLAIDRTTYDMDDQSEEFGEVPVRERLNRSVRTQAVRYGRPDIPEKRPLSRTRMTDEECFSQDVVEYRMGQHVRHKTYGSGRILNISGFGNDMKIDVLFNDGNRRRLMAKFANFERN